MKVDLGQILLGLFADLVNLVRDGLCKLFEVFLFLQKKRISLLLILPKTQIVSVTRVDFLKVGHMVQIIEIALSICALCLRPTFEKLVTGKKSWPSALKIGERRNISARRKQFMKSTPERLKKNKAILEKNLSNIMLTKYYEK